MGGFQLNSILCKIESNKGVLQSLPNISDMDFNQKWQPFHKRLNSTGYYRKYIPVAETFNSIVYTF